MLSKRETARRWSAAANGPKRGRKVKSYDALEIAEPLHECTAETVTCDVLDRIAHEQMSALLHAAIDSLENKRQRDILKLRYGLDCPDALTLQEVSVLYSLTRERIRQIEGKAIRLLRGPARFKALEHLLPQRREPPPAPHVYAFENNCVSFDELRRLVDVEAVELRRFNKDWRTKLERRRLAELPAEPDPVASPQPKVTLSAIKDMFEATTGLDVSSLTATPFDHCLHIEVKLDIAKQIGSDSTPFTRIVMRDQIYQLDRTINIIVNRLRDMLCTTLRRDVGDRWQSARIALAGRLSGIPQDAHGPVVQDRIETAVEINDGR